MTGARHMDTAGPGWSALVTVGRGAGADHPGPTPD